MQTSPTFKLVLIGESGVGKTSLFMRIKEDRFCSEATLGLEFCSTDINVDGFRIKLAVWDTAGVERFRTLTRNYYRHCHCALLVCSLDDKTSLDNLHRWNQDVDFYCKDCVKIIIANKNDLTQEISNGQLQNFASTFGCSQVFQLSAKTGDGVSEMLAEAGRILMGAHLPAAGRKSSRSPPTGGSAASTGAAASSGVVKLQDAGRRRSAGLEVRQDQRNPGCQDSDEENSDKYNCCVLL